MDRPPLRADRRVAGLRLDRRSLVTWTAIGCSLAAFIRLLYAGLPLTADEGGYATLARLWARGAELYDEAWVDRPQGLMIVFRAITAISPTAEALRLAAIAIAMAIVVLVALVGRKVTGDRPARYAVLLVATAGASPFIESFTLSGELIASLFSVGSMLAFEPAARPGIQDLAGRLRRFSASGAPRNRLALAVAFVLILIVSAVLFFPLRQTGQRSVARTGALAANPAIPEKSIAVLPFENLSDLKQNAYFADGVQDEILTALARVADLKVISRSSVTQYKSGVARDLREIAHQLGVANILEGSVQRVGNRVRINAQLVDTRTDRQLWAQTFDRDVTDVFAVEDEIAETIADQLKAKLSPAEKSAIERVPTTDLTAFALYTRAQNLLLTSFSSTAKAKTEQAADLLDQAVTRDPSFFRAYCLLAYAHDQLYFLGFDHTAARLVLAEAAIERLYGLRGGASVYRCLARLRTMGLIAELRPALRPVRNPGLFHLTDLGIATVSVDQQVDPESLARRARLRGARWARRHLLPRRAGVARPLRRCAHSDYLRDQHPFWSESTVLSALFAPKQCLPSSESAQIIGRPPGESGQPWPSHWPLASAASAQLQETERSTQKRSPVKLARVQ